MTCAQRSGRFTWVFRVCCFALLVVSCGRSEESTVSADRTGSTVCPTFVSERLSFIDLIELGGAWVETEGFTATPNPAYGDAVKDLYGRGVTENPTLRAATYSSMTFKNPVVRRLGPVKDADYTSVRPIVVHDAMIDGINENDRLLMAITQTFAPATEDDRDVYDVDFVQTVGVIDDTGRLVFDPCTDTSLFDSLADIDLDSDDSFTRFLALLEDGWNSGGFEEDVPPALGVEQWTKRSIYLRALSDENVPKDLRARFREIIVDFEVDTVATSSHQFVCFLTNQGWSACTALDTNETAGELASLPLELPPESWLEAFLVNEPTYDDLADSTKRISLGRIEWPDFEPLLGPSSMEREEPIRASLNLVDFATVKTGEESRFALRDS